MFTKLMRRLGWVRRSEHQRLLTQHIQLLDDHERMIRLAQVLLRQTEGEAGKNDGAESRSKAAPVTANPPKPAKLH